MLIIRKEDNHMLTLRELSLVSLGASIGANCIPCAVYHLKQCRKSDLSDDQIKAAIDAAVKVKNVPADNVFATLLRRLGEIEDSIERRDETCSCC
jgi:AhpD family alkylhydroperoxidase